MELLFANPFYDPGPRNGFHFPDVSSYLNNNIIDRVTDQVMKNGSGAKLAETATTYDSTTLTGYSGATHHDDSNYGTSNTVRGNPTLVQQWVSGTTYLSTTSYFDTTGQVTHGQNNRSRRTRLRRQPDAGDVLPLRYAG